MLLGCFGGCGDDKAKVTPLVNVSPTTGLTTTEAGGQAFFSVSLGTAPSADVTIAISSSDTTEGTVSPATLTFTKANFAAPQVVTMAGVDDAVADGNVAYTIVLAPVVSTDKKYAGLDPADVTVTNIDSETAGVTVTPVAGLRTTEAGGAATFTVVLNSQPAGDVTIPVASQDATEGTAAPATLTFTNLNWNAPQTVTVTGVDDTEADGEVAYTIALGLSTSADPAYIIDAADVAISNVDNDTAGVAVQPTSGLVVSENGTTASFKITLNTKPTADVVIPLVSSDTGEATVSPASFTFTPANWNAPQTAMVTGVNDDVADGNQPFTIATGPATSADLTYNAVNPADVTGITQDNDSPGFVFAPLTPLVTSEDGTSTTFTVALQSKPSANVTIALSSSKPAEGTVAPASLTFTTDNWNAPQTVTITGVNDDAADGNQVYSIVTGAATSTDAGYNGVDPLDVPVTNNDNDMPAILVVAAANLTTTEAGGTATFTVRLQTRPSGNVTIPVSSSDTSEGTVSPTQLVFTPDNWNGVRNVTVTGVNDDDIDGNQVYKIVLAPAVSSDVGYDTRDAADVELTNTDNDTPNVIVSPTSGLVTTERGGQATFTIVLATRPTGDVTFPVASSKTTEGTVSTSTVTFTRDSWASPKTVTVTGVNDDEADGNQPYTIVIGEGISEDVNYKSRNPADVTVSNTDDDSAGITITPVEGLLTTEKGGQAKFTIRLNSKPSSPVTVNFTSSDATEGTVSPASYVFTLADWNSLKEVTITGVADNVFDGDQLYTIITSQAASTDAAYAAINPPDVAVLNDDANPGVRVTPLAISTTEAGGSASFTVALNTQPADNVKISIASSKVAEGEADTTELVFTPANWESEQRVTVAGKDDAVADGDVEFAIVTGLTVSPDAEYNNLPVDDVKVTNIDDETPNIRVALLGANRTRESGTTTKISVVLNSQPTADVTVPVESSDTTEGAVNKVSLTFSAANWNAPQEVTVTGVDDKLADGLQEYTVRFLAATSADMKYNGLDASDVVLSNIDDEQAGFTVTPTVLVTNEAGNLAPKFSVVLNSEPTKDVKIAVSSGNTAEGQVSDAELVFTSANWFSPQFITLTGKDDAVQDGDRGYAVILAPATSDDPGYNGLDPQDVSVTNIDNDTAGVIVTANSGLQTTEEGGKAAFTVALRTQPVANVTIAVRSGDLTEGLVSTELLTFTAANWNAQQEVTVTGVNDDVADGDQVFEIILDPSQSTDPNYVGKKDRNVQITNKDDEQPGIEVVGPGESGLVTDEGGKQATFTMRLRSQPTADVTVALSVSNGEAAASPAKLTFNSVNWKGLQTVTVTGLDDPSKDGDRPYVVITAPAESSDAKYNGVDAENVAGINQDNDSAGIVVDSDEAITVNEDGTKTATFYVTLKSKPTAAVTLPGIVVSDASEATIDKTTITIAPDEWNGKKFVKVTGVNDNLADGNQDFSISFYNSSSTDPDYNNQPISPLPGKTLDDETAGVNLTPATGLVTNENGQTSSFKVRLQSQPTADVTVSFTVNDTAEMETPASVVFTAGNWNVEQTVTVKGKNDDVADGNQAFVITAKSTSATDTSYAAKTWGTVKGTNNDDETPGFTLSRTRGLVTSESGTKDSFTVVLNSRPKAGVTITLTGNPAEGALSVTTLTFTTTGDDWKTPRTVEITGADDNVSDGNQAYLILVSSATSADADYAARPQQTVEVTNSDND
ncbi:MAG: Calx-beta domain-containing protein [Deltaproteobacteria bacterium]|nr:Calx-beta domain-containing protein [Deltaproteobacteria bacterium]